MTCIKFLTVAAVMRLLFFFVTYIEFYMKVIIISFLLTVIVFLLAAFVAALFRVSSFKNEDDGGF